MLPSADGQAYASPTLSRKDVLDSQLADLYAHGFTIATLYDSPETLWDAMTEYKNYGLGTAYNLYKGDGDPQAVEKQRNDHSDPALTYYANPEPNDAALSRMAPLEKLGTSRMSPISRTRTISRPWGRTPISRSITVTPNTRRSSCGPTASVSR